MPIGKQFLVSWIVDERFMIGIAQRIYMRLLIVV